jgi:hypothetical protein
MALGEQQHKASSQQPICMTKAGDGGAPRASRSPARQARPAAAPLSLRPTQRPGDLGAGGGWHASKRALSCVCLGGAMQGLGLGCRTKARI